MLLGKISLVSILKSNKLYFRIFTGADVIETLPSLHPLIRLHNNIGQNRMDTFLGALTDDLVVKDSTVDVKEERINDTNSIPDIPLR